MKKVFLFLPIFCLIFVGCNEPLEYNNFAEIHYNFFTAQNENFLIDVWSGKREEPYEMDGVANTLVDFAIICVKPKTNVDELSCSVDINGKTEVLSLEKSPFDDTFAADLGRIVSKDDSIVVCLSEKGVSEVLPLTCVSSEYKIDYESAFKIGYDRVKPFLNELDSYEIYLKIISPKTEQIQFWYFRVLAHESEFVYVIDVNSGEVLVSR